MSALLAERVQTLGQAHTIMAAAKDAARELTNEETKQVGELLDVVEKIDGELAAEAARNEVSSRLDALAGDVVVEQKHQEPEPASTLGEHFTKSYAAAREAGTPRNASHVAAEFKAVTDPVTSSGFDAALTTVDTNIVRNYVAPAVVSDLIPTSTIDGKIIKYYREGAREGNFATVAEGGQKPQMTYGAPTQVETSLKKIAAWFDISDEMVEDLGFVASEINSRGVRDLGLVEEAQLLSGNGVGENLTGLLATSGIQAEVSANKLADHVDAVFRAVMKVMNGSGMFADAIVVNPVDYERVRLMKDSTGSYYGGGPFFGAVGGAAPALQVPLWGLRTVVTPNIAAGTALVGSYAQAATQYTKGGVTVEATNSDGSKFTKNLRTIRIEKRLALAVRQPAGFAKVTLTPPV